MVEIYAVKVPKKINQTTYNRLLTIINEDRKNIINAFLFKEDAYRSLIGDVLVRVVASRQLKIDNNQLSFFQNEYGKPLLRTTADFHFNVSHAGEWVVCTHSNSEVGVDVEYIQPIDLDLAKYYFSENEYRELKEKEEGEQLSYFYDLWTLKESYIKARGKGLSISLKSFSVSVRNKTISIATDDKKSWYFRQYEIDKSYKLAVCSSVSQFPKRINFVTIECLLRQVTL